MFLLFASDYALSPFPSSGFDWLHALHFVYVQKLHCNQFIVKPGPDPLILKMKVACSQKLVSTYLASHCQKAGDHNVNIFSKNHKNKSD
jgi:hypothetical protein